jgi:hypothetical protein
VAFSICAAHATANSRPAVQVLAAIRSDVRTIEAAMQDSNMATNTILQALHFKDYIASYAKYLQKRPEWHARLREIGVNALQQPAGARAASRPRRCTVAPASAPPPCMRHTA